MLKQATATAPGKIILIGEHAVVHGYPAIISTIGLRAQCTIKKNGPGKVRLKLTRFDFEKDFSWEEIFKANEDAEKNIKEYEKTGNRKLLTKLKEVSNLPKYALFETLKYLKIKELPGIVLEGDSKIPIGGFGASSAVGAVIIKAFAKFLGTTLTDDQVVEILLKAEYKLQGYFSTGADQNTVVRGGLLKFRPRIGRLKQRIEHIQPQGDLLEDCLIIESGKPENTTGEVVAFVKELKKKKPLLVDDIFEKIHKLTKKMTKALESGDEDLFFSTVDDSGELLIELGVVRPKTQILIEKIQLFGGHVKVTGGGAISGKGSGALICFAKNYSSIIKYLNTEKIDYIRTKLA